MATNPIEQRIEQIVDEWDISKTESQARVVRILSQRDEQDIVDTFFTYMIATDTDIMDIAFHFDAMYTNDEEYTKSLLEELKETITIWNTSQKEGEQDEQETSEKIDWEVDYSIGKEMGWAGVFTANFNKLAEALHLLEGNYTVAILKNTNKSKNFIQWLFKCLDYGISEKVRFLVTDTVNNPVFDSLSREGKQKVYTLFLNLNMPLAMQQVTSMLPPDEPSTKYRKAFISMTKAIEEEKESEAEKYGEVCITEAQNLLSKDPYWLTQLVVVYTILSNDKMRYKKDKEVLEYADKAVATAVIAESQLEKSVSQALLAQTLLYRGTIYYIKEKWESSYTDYLTAYELYLQSDNPILLIEAARMLANAGFHCNKTKEAMEALKVAVSLGKVLSKEAAFGSSYCIAVDTFMEKNHEKYLSYDEIEAICEPLFGKQWREIVSSWKKVSDEEALNKIVEQINS